MERPVLRMHFSDRSGAEFERLVFAYVSRQKRWDKIEWLGQVGQDGGRDIWGKLKGRTTCYQCANYQKLTFKKAKEDIDKLKGKSIPNNLIVVCGGTVAPSLRDKIEEYGKKAGVKKVEVWSGVEFEERLRKETPELVKRFFDGEPFPDSPDELIKAAKDTAGRNDREILILLGECLDRPAMTTPFRMECSLPDFERALGNIIECLNTGVQRGGDGRSSRSIPSRHRIADSAIKDEMATITTLIIQLRDTFTDLKRKKEIRPCGCGQPDCHTHMLSSEACRMMDEMRGEVLKRFRELNADFKAQIYEVKEEKAEGMSGFISKIKARKARETFLDSSEGVRAALGEIAFIHNYFQKQVDDFNSQLLGLHMLPKPDPERNYFYIYCKGIILYYMWNPGFGGLLSGSRLKLEIYEGEIPGHGPDPFRHRVLENVKRYEFDYQEGLMGWSGVEPKTPFISTQQLLQEWFKLYEKQIERKVENS
jgi:hypothetical protein